MTSDVVEIAGRRWVIERLELAGVVYYGCGVLPLRNRREDLIEDITRSQGPEWRGVSHPEDVPADRHCSGTGRRRVLRF